MADQSIWRTRMRYLLAAIYFGVGVVHLRSPEALLPIMPLWVPHPREVILITGLCEIAGALALLTQRFRSAAGIGLALYAICVFPANIKHAMDGIPLAGMQLGCWYHGPRLAFQPVFVWWSLWVGGVINWPFKADGQDHILA
jgi:uncharacterized membrane protein